MVGTYTKFTSLYKPLGDLKPLLCLHSALQTIMVKRRKVQPELTPVFLRSLD